MWIISILSLYARYPMKYHSTLLNIFMTLSLLLGISVLVAVFMGSGVLPQLGDSLAETIIGMMEGDGTISVEVGSVDSPLFESVVLRDISVGNAGDNQPFAEIESLSLDLPAYRLLFWQRLSGNLALTVNAPHINLEDAAWRKMSARLFPTQSMDSSLPVSNNISYGVTVTEGSLDLLIDTFKASADHLNGSVLINSDLSLQQGEASLGPLSVSLPIGSFHLESSSLSLGQTNTGEAGLRFNGTKASLSLTGSYLELESDFLEATMSAVSLENLWEGEGRASIALSNTLFSTIVSSMPVSVNMAFLGGSLELTAFNPSRFALDMDSLGMDMLFNQNIPIHLDIPGMAFSGFSDINQTLSSHMVPDSAITVSIQDRTALMLSALALDVDFSDDYSSLRVAWDSLDIENQPFFSQVAGMDISFLESASVDALHLFLSYNQKTGLLNGEVSLDMESDMVLGPVKQLEGSVIGDFSLSRDLDSALATIHLTNLKSPQIPGNTTSDIRYTRENSLSQTLSATLMHDEGLYASASYAFPDDSIKASLRLDDFQPIVFSQLIHDISPSLENYIVENTTVEGNASATFGRDLQSGKGSAEIGVANMNLEDQQYNFATTVSGSMDTGNILVDSATLTTEGLRLSYRGILSRKSLFPEGNLLLQKAQTGESLVSVDFFIKGPRSYGYSFISPYFPDNTLEGMVSMDTEGRLFADAVLSHPQYSYPFDVQADLLKGVFSFNSKGFAMGIEIGQIPGHVGGSLSLDGFTLPPFPDGLLHGTMRTTGNLSFDYAISSGYFTISSDLLAIDGLSWTNGVDWNLNSGLSITSTALDLQNLTYRDTLGELKGFLHLENTDILSLLSRDVQNFEAIAVLDGNAEKKEHIELSVFSETSDPGTVKGFADIKSLAVSRFSTSFGNLFLNLSLLGSTDSDGHIDLHSQASLESEGISTIQPFAAIAVDVDDSKISIHDGFLIYGTNSLTQVEGLLSYSGEAYLKAHLEADMFSNWKDNLSTSDVKISTQLAPAENFLDYLSGFAVLGEKPFSGKLSLSDTWLLDDIHLADSVYQIDIGSDIFSISQGFKNNLSGYYRFSDGSMDFTATSDFLFAFHAVGTVTGKQISLLLEDIVFPISYLNPTFNIPVIDFNQGSMHGELRVEGPLADPKYFGIAYVDNLEATTFWTQRDTLFVKNPVAIISENRISVAKTPLKAVDAGGKTVSGYISFEATLERWNLPFYRVDVSIPDDPLYIWVPIPNIDMNIESMVSGDFSIAGTSQSEMLTGQVIASDGLISFTLVDLPAWYNVESHTSLDIGLTTGKNFTFVYPTKESPIVKAVIDDNQHIRMTLDADTLDMGFEGQLAFRSGEIYYVQKNFYITEGSLLFKAATGAGASEVNPIINMRARLRDFDEDGDKIDIYLVLQDSTLDNLSPRFESIPWRSTNDILNILGQSLLPSNSYSEGGISSVVAIASVATDVISRLGIIDAATGSLGISQILRDSLGLDIFSIRSSLIQNILFDAIPGASVDNSASPLSRYLDNTTIYLGKYLFNDLYLQGLFHFKSNKTGSANHSSFLANDLSVDMELSLEWENPLATFSIFTQPDELSIFNLLDTIGFSVTKRIAF